MSNTKKEAYIRDWRIQKIKWWLSGFGESGAAGQIKPRSLIKELNSCGAGYFFSPLF